MPARETYRQAKAAAVQGVGGDFTGYHDHRDSLERLDRHGHQRRSPTAQAAKHRAIEHASRAGRPLALGRYWLHVFKRLLPLAVLTVLATADVRFRDELSTEQIAAKLFIGKVTVRTHVANVLKMRACGLPCPCGQRETPLS